MRSREHLQQVHCWITLAAWTSLVSPGTKSPMAHLQSRPCCVFGNALCCSERCCALQNMSMACCKRCEQPEGLVTETSIVFGQRVYTDWCWTPCLRVRGRSKAIAVGRTRPQFRYRGHCQAFASQGLKRPLCTAQRLCGYCASQCTWLTCAARCCACRMVLPADYDGFSAAKKQDVLWDQCKATAYDAAAIAANNTDASGFESLQIMVPFYT